MAGIHPFHGVHYNRSLVKDPATVICPPYDIISPPMKQELYQSSEYNFVRLEYGRELPQDKDTDNRYTRSAATLSEWLEQGVLTIDRTPAIYLHSIVLLVRERNTGVVVSSAWLNWKNGIIWLSALLRVHYLSQRATG